MTIFICRHGHKDTMHTGGQCLRCWKRNEIREIICILNEDGSLAEVYGQGFLSMGTCAVCDSLIEQDQAFDTDYLCKGCRESSEVVR